MLRIRREDGTSRELADTEFIELLNPVTKEVVQVLHWSRRLNSLREILPGSERAKNYKKLFPEVKFEDKEDTNNG